MKKYFCASDIHSFYDEWMRALEESGFDLKNPEHVVIICGDLFDRGSQSQECYQFVKSMIDKNRCVYVRGNHEDLLFDCVKELKLSHVGYHHNSNGTIRTLSDFMNCSEYDLICGCYETAKFNRITKELEDFIDKNCVDYFDLGDKVFVHGWIPSYQHIDDYHHATSDDWKEARWENGMEMYRLNITVPDKTVVCGHWHTSYGHQKLTKKCTTEFGADACFDSLILDGIIALDACTAYTHKVNVVVFDEHGNLMEG